MKVISIEGKKTKKSSRRGLVPSLDIPAVYATPLLYCVAVLLSTQKDLMQQALAAG